MTPDRYSRWRRASCALARIEPSLTSTVEWLGRLDVQHVMEDQRFLNLNEHLKVTTAEIHRFSDHYTMSYLWVLESCEVLRTINKRVRSTPGLLPPDACRLLREIERAFENVQLKPAREHMVCDSLVFSPVLDPELGIGWQVSRTSSITRRELSDAFLDVLERIQYYKPFKLEPPKFLRIE